jgi:hypothetical protein
MNKNATICYRVYLIRSSEVSEIVCSLSRGLALEGCSGREVLGPPDFLGDKLLVRNGDTAGVYNRGGRRATRNETVEDVPVGQREGSSGATNLMGQVKVFALLDRVMGGRGGQTDVAAEAPNASRMIDFVGLGGLVVEAGSRDIEPPEELLKFSIGRVLDSLAQFVCD